MARRRNRGEYKKKYTNYKCTNDECKASWSSYHGWTMVMNLTEKCKKCCKANGKPINIEEKMTEVDVYVCQSCDIPFHCIAAEDATHPNPESKPCLQPNCGQRGSKTGTQFRHAKQITYECNMKACGNVWISPNFGKLYTQMCRKCHCKGQITGTRVETPEEAAVAKNGRRYPHWLRGGQHDQEGCDMCQELKKFGTTCNGKRKVRIHEKVHEDGRIEIESVQWEFGRGEGPTPP